MLKEIPWICGFCMVITLSAAVGPAPLADAARRDDVAAVRALLKGKAADVNVAAADGSTALHFAVHNNDLEVVRALLSAGANAKAVTRYGVQPIALAAENGNAAAIDLLLNAGADPNAAMPEGETALMTAARAGKADAVKTLLVHGANPQARDEFLGQTALMWAAGRNNVEAIRMLIEFGADIKARTDHLPRPADSRGGGYTITAIPPTGFTAFLFAVREGQIDAAKALLDAGADVNDTVSDGESALVIACANANWELASALLDRGADPNLAAAGWNALHQAVRERRPNNFFGMPGPITTGTLDSFDLIKKMVPRITDINARMTKNGMKDGQRNRLNRLGATAFLLAAKNTDTEIMKLLLAHGANPGIPTADLTTPLMVAAGVAIWNPGEDGGSLPGMEQEVLDAVKMCVAQGNDVNATNMYKDTALHGTGYRGAPLVAEYLVQQGAKLDAKDYRGFTPLTVAQGISFTEFYKSQPATADVLRKLMKERGISTEDQVANGKECVGCARELGSPEFVKRDRQMETDFNSWYRKTDHSTPFAPRWDVQ